MEVNMTNLSTFLNSAIGFDNFFERFDSFSSLNTGFPHFNIIKVKDDTYNIELALAGYKKDEVSVEVKDNILSIEGSSEDKEVQFIHKGIAKRSFKKMFQLADYVECESSKLEDGMLKIKLKHNKPEAKTKSIKID
jgi:molecular chaperone IbpA